MPRSIESEEVWRMECNDYTASILKMTYQRGYGEQVLFLPRHQITELPHTLVYMHYYKSLSYAKKKVLRKIDDYVSRGWTKEGYEKVFGTEWLKNSEPRMAKEEE